MNDYSNPKPVKTDESVPAFQTDVAQADAVRASALAGLQQLHRVRRTYAIREQTQLAATLGEDHPDVVRLKAEVEAHQHYGSVLDAEVDRATAPAPARNERGWVLYGFVRNRELQGQPNLTVAMFDGANRWVEALGHTCTNDRGYFQLSFTAAKEAHVEQWREVFVRVSDAKRQQLFCDKKPMSVVLGEVRYREIVIGHESAICPPPSDTSSPKPPPNELPPEKPTTQKAGAKKKAPKKAKG